MFSNKFHHLLSVNVWFLYLLHICCIMHVPCCCARMGKLEEERKGVFWLIVPGCSWSWQGSQGTCGLRQCCIHSHKMKRNECRSSILLPFHWAGACIFSVDLLISISPASKFLPSRAQGLAPSDSWFCDSQCYKCTSCRPEMQTHHL